MLLVKVIEQITLVDDAVAVVLSLFQVLFGKPDIFAQPPAADGIRGRETLLQSSVFARAIVPPSLSHYIYIIPLPGRDNKDAAASGHFVSK